jgi:hypothetical protein
MKVQKNRGGTAITDSEAEIERCKLRIANLKQSIKVFRDREASGEAFPGTKNINAELAHYPCRNVEDRRLDWRE